jgi:hypothetical protein
MKYLSMMHVRNVVEAPPSPLPNSILQDQARADEGQNAGTFDLA